MSVRQLLLTLAREAQVNIIVDPRVLDVPVTLSLTEQPLERALQLICQTVGLEMTQQEGTYYITIDRRRYVSLPNLGDLPEAALMVPAQHLLQPITLHLVNVPLTVGLKQLDALTNLRLIVDESVPADLRVSCTFRETPLSRCLYMLLVPSGLYAVPERQERQPPGLRILSPVSVIIRRPGEDEPKHLEYYPDNYRGSLGYLLAPAFWQMPQAYGCQVVTDTYRQPLVVYQPLPPAPRPQETPPPARGPGS